jgi:copper chaperone CopZ
MKKKKKKEEEVAGIVAGAGAGAGAAVSISPRNHTNMNTNNTDDDDDDDDDNDQVLEEVGEEGDQDVVKKPQSCCSAAVVNVADGNGHGYDHGNSMEVIPAPKLYGDPNKTPVVFVSEGGDIQIAMSLTGITCDHCVKIIETVLKGVNGSPSPIRGIIDAAADRELSSVIIKITKSSFAKRITYEASENLKMVGYDAKPKEMGIVDPSSGAAVDLGALRMAFDVVAATDAKDVFDWNLKCSCSDNGIVRTDCDRHSQMNTRIFDAFDERLRQVEEFMAGCGKKYGMPCNCGTACQCNSGRCCGGGGNGNATVALDLQSRTSTANLNNSNSNSNSCGVGGMEQHLNVNSNATMSMSSAFPFSTSMSMTGSMNNNAPQSQGVQHTMYNNAGPIPAPIMSQSTHSHSHSHSHSHPQTLGMGMAQQSIVGMQTLTPDSIMSNGNATFGVQQANQFHQQQQQQSQAQVQAAFMQQQQANYHQMTMNGAMLNGGNFVPVPSVNNMMLSINAMVGQGLPNSGNWTDAQQQQSNSNNVVNGRDQHSWPSN